TLNASNQHDGPTAHRSHQKIGRVGSTGLFVSRGVGKFADISISASFSSWRDPKIPRRSSAADF
ncbi:hypothetical protein, partial [Pinisolibacter sp.]|uniref:hypothetical protein n=1 Tax=Pinisolibacter sp. TaxID=2172024 RepID=UPI002FDCFD29